MQPSPLYLSKLFALSVGIFFIFSCTSYAQPKINSCATQFSNSQCADNLNQILPELRKAKVVYLGETHDSTKDPSKSVKNYSTII